MGDSGNLDLEPARMVMGKREKQQPLRDSPTLSSYGIVDGSALEFEMIGWKPELCRDREGRRGKRRD